MLLQSSEDETIHRVAAGAIANLAMNGKAFYICYFRFSEYSINLAEKTTALGSDFLRVSFQKPTRNL